ncbi:alpha-glucan family phosphorylase [Desulfoscipio gibsoniae]|uniref:glycogen phosphorylase n=1 Tax=Desulfoscipio gibsoniae DSM 7213 TaxID=767817 RepID=R4KNE1_9FIRM|nr:alpha-glucan family phosphorylase [Desulfoscipio gibsoniae]AGL03077.1 alpha-glucan phosphorylase [Desulfoscipio gibsoniae DSM 7213]
MFYFRTVTVNPPLPERIARLRDLSYNLWFSWHSPARELYREINPGLWEQVEHNPVKFLQRVHREELDRVAANQHFLEKYDAVMARYDRYMSEEKWFQQTYPRFKDKNIAYFSAEFGLHESLPIYSGGLGVLAGDHTKSASDLGLPFVGVGLLYKHGYFNQFINPEGRQETYYPDLNFNEMPIIPVVGESGLDTTVSVELPGRTVHIRIWKVQVGLSQLILLDADLPLNMEEDRKITGQLYGGGREMRIAQEIVLGVGGVRALRTLGITPAVWHINEGHSAFLTLERLREMVSQGVPSATAREAIRANTIFTTHTPVPAGHDVFDRDMTEKYLAELCRDTGMDCDTLLELGWDAQQDEFNMTVLAMRMAGFCNGVSKLHGEVTRQMLHRFYPAIPVEEVPVTSVTNGVHTRSWIAEVWKNIFSQYLGENWADKVTDPAMWQRIDEIPDQVIWDTHMYLKEQAIQYIRDRIKKNCRRNHGSEALIAEAGGVLLPHALTIGFARRFATYKRAALIFNDPERLAAILNDLDRPVQIVFAGKAHPKDGEGQELIKKIIDFSREEPFKGKIVFLENYDINVARHLVHGVDVWLNTPRWPMEASGTSGMKAAMNGVLHCSVLDGWWPEAYNGKNGFAIGHPGDLQLHETQQDKSDTYYLYRVLEEKVIPLYYDRQNDIPGQWAAMMRSSMRTIIPIFSTARMVMEYTDRLYAAAIDRGIAFMESNYAAAEQACRFKRFIQENWHHVKVERTDSNGRWDMQAGEELVVGSVVKLGPIRPSEVAVEIAFGSDQGPYISNLNTIIMELKETLGDGTYRYTGKVPLSQGTYGYTVRVRPAHQYMYGKFEIPLVRWAECF